MVMRFQPARLLPPVFLLLALVGISYWLNPEPWHHLSAGTKGLFAFAGLVFAGLGLAMRRRGYLRIDEQGLEVQYLAGKPRAYGWNDIVSVVVIRKRVLLIPVMHSVGLTLRDGTQGVSAVQRVTGGVLGYQSTFPAWFDESAVEIAERINFVLRQRQPG